MKSSFSDRISELLYDYDCVIVPDLGGIVANYRPARLDKHLNVFYPPGKDLSFNKNLNKNDGILADAISRAENLTHEQANAKIKEEVERYFSTLNSGDRVVFNKVGILYFDKNQKLQFSPDESVNYLLESFGLKKVHAVPTEKKKPVEKKEPIAPVLPVTPVKKVAEPEVKKTEKAEVIVVPISAPYAQTEVEEEVLASSPKKWYLVAALIPLLLYMGLVTEHSNVIHDGDVHWGDLTLSDSVIPSSYEARTETFSLDTEEMPDLLSETSEAVMSNEDVSTDKDTESEPSLDSNTYVPEEIPVHSESLSSATEPVATIISAAAPISTYVAPSEISHLQYHIVAGCYSVKENATRMVDKLRAKGFDAYIIDKRKGLHRVTFGSFAMRQKAIDFLAEIKENEDESAWLLRKR
jgi:cell division septation protein DedD